MQKKKQLQGSNSGQNETEIERSSSKRIGKTEEQNKQQQKAEESRVKQSGCRANNSRNQ